MKTNEPKIYKVNAEGQSMGRLATDIAYHLRDKHLASYEPNKSGTTVVEVENVEKLVITGKKLEQNATIWHSLYPGGLKKRNWKDQDLADLLKQCVYGMLPKNKLRDEAMKRLIITKS